MLTNSILQIMFAKCLIVTSGTEYVLVYKGVSEYVSACLCVSECVLPCVWCVSGRWIQINFMEVSRVNLEEQITAWTLAVTVCKCMYVLFESVLVKTHHTSEAHAGLL